MARPRVYSIHAFHERVVGLQEFVVSIIKLPLYSTN